LTVTVGRLPELVAVALLEARATNLAGVAVALASAAAAATIAIAHFMLDPVGDQVGLERRVSQGTGVVEQGYMSEKNNKSPGNECKSLMEEKWRVRKGEEKRQKVVVDVEGEIVGGGKFDTVVRSTNNHPRPIPSPFRGDGTGMTHH